MKWPKPNKPCPDCGASCPHYPFDDILVLRCQSCGWAIGADDMDSAVENWDRRARSRTGSFEHGDDVQWKLNMTKPERIDLVGCSPEFFDQIDALPLVSRAGEPE